MSAPHRSIVSVPAAAALALTCALLATANTHADFTWDGGGADDLFSTDDNWVGNTAPPLDFGDMLLIFGPTGAAQSPDLEAGDYFDISGIRWTNADASLTLIGTGSLTLNDGASILNDSNFAQTINVDIIGSGDELIIDAMSADLTIGGDIDLTDGVMLTVQGSEDTTISGEISGLNQAMLFKTGAGTLLLDSENTYSGGTEIEQGTIIVGNDDALGSGDLTASGDSSLASNDDGRVIDNRVNIEEDVTLALNGTNDLELSGRISGDGILELNAGADDTEFMLSGNNRHAATTIKRGIAVVGDNRAFGNGEVVVKGNGGIASSANNRIVSNDFKINEDANLTFTGDSRIRLTGVISGAGTFTVDTDQIATQLFLDGENTFTGGVIFNQGTIVLGNASALGTERLTLTGDGRLRSSVGTPGFAIDNDIALGNNDLRIAGTNGFTINGLISGPGTLTVRLAQDARLTLTENNTFTGLTSVTRGELFLTDTGSLGGDVTVDGEGFLLGDGRINGSLLVEKGGTISPSTGITDMRITGDFTLGDDGTYTVEVDRDTVEADLLVVDGTATLSDDATIMASVSGETFVASGQQFTIINAAGGVTDNGVEIDSESATLTFELIRNTDFMDGDQIFALEIFRDANAYSNAAEGANNIAIGVALDDLLDDANADPDGEVAALLGELDALDDDTYNTGLTELNPEPYNAITNVTAENLKVFNHQLSNYLSSRRHGIQNWRRVAGSVMPRPGSLAMANNDPAILANAIAQMEQAEDDDEQLDIDGEERKRGFDERLGTFAQFHGTFLDRDNGANVTGYDANLFGATAGLDYQINNNTVAGIALGYQFSDVDFKADRGTLEDNSVRIGPFASWSKGPLFIDASLSFGWHMYDMDRQIMTIGRSADADFDAYDISGYLRGGYDFRLNDYTYITPHASVQYTYLDMEGFSESGAGAADLDIDSRDSDSLRTRLGAALNWKFDVGLVILPTVYGGWEHELLDDDDLDASFKAGGSSFSIDTGDRDENVFYFGLGVNVLFQRNVAGFFRFEKQWGDDTEISGVAGGLTFRF